MTLFDKDTRVQPVGFVEALRHTIGKSVMNVLKEDMLLTARVIEVCTGLSASCHAEIHAYQQGFESFSTDSVFVVDMITHLTNYVISVVALYT